MIPALVMTYVPRVHENSVGLVERWPSDGDLEFLLDGVDTENDFAGEVDLVETVVAHHVSGLNIKSV